MKKEVTIAIIIGFILGLIITYFIYLAQHQNTTINQTLATPLPTPINLQSESTPSASLTITSPFNNSVVNETPLSISGKTQPLSYITAINKTHQALTKSNLNGDFQINLNLEKGLNLINISVFSDTKQITNQTLTLVFQSEDPPSTPAASPKPTN